MSEVLDSTVEWDSGAHAVKVTDANYQAKVDSGEVKLDPWGREYSKNWDANWIKLKDLEQTGFYTQYKDWKGSRKYLETERDWDYKEFADQWSQRIRSYYEAQLNIDYRTIDEKKFADTLLKNMTGMSSFREFQTREVIKEYIAWVKKNKVIAKGYADPELSVVFDAGFLWVPTRFKFMIVSAIDSSQTFLDNYDASSASDSFALKKGVWYDGYALVSLNTNYANMRHAHYAVEDLENMFMKHYYSYSILR